MGVKVNATLYPTPQSFWRQSRNLKVIPVFTTNMLGKISVADAFNAWSSRVKTMEINVKQNGGLLSYQKDQALKKGIRVAVFQAIPDGPRSDSFTRIPARAATSCRTFTIPTMSIARSQVGIPMIGEGRCRSSSSNASA